MLGNRVGWSSRSHQPTKGERVVIKYGTKLTRVRFTGGFNRGKEIITLTKDKIYEVFENKFGEPGWVKIRNDKNKLMYYSAQFFEVDR